jgi:hypothetical protein
LEVQVPDLEACARAISSDEDKTFHCNNCENKYRSITFPSTHTESCAACGQPRKCIVKAAIHRLYGGQDYEGNFHKTAFTIDSLKDVLSANGFSNFILLEEEHQLKNWNIKMRATKVENIWGDEP